MVFKRINQFSKKERSIVGPREKTLKNQGLFYFEDALSSLFQ